MVTLLSENHHVSTIVKMIRAIPHLPPQRISKFPEDFHIFGDFLAITRLSTLMVILNRIVQLVDYVRQYWLTTVRPFGFTVYSIDCVPLKVEYRGKPYKQSTASEYKDQLCLAETQITAFWLMLDKAYSICYDTMAYLRRASYSVKGYTNMEKGPLANDLGQLQMQMVGLQPLPPMLLPFHIRGARRPGGHGRQRSAAAAVPQMVRHPERPNVRQQPESGNILFIEDHNLLRILNFIEAPIQIQCKCIEIECGIVVINILCLN
ncbi:uncharacterized protein LOC111028032 isoform X2 [Myzus persicae]|uniref:uncharacterized protein LOC111028032 isoform X2 n=1 Tax=Myzus persicae TaxID=13164 RepID=UPI000B935422|nr:uncharacterized protein LOC111028032 isoform X2 [Myzus persicae]